MMTTHFPAGIGAESKASFTLAGVLRLSLGDDADVLDQAKAAYRLDDHTFRILDGSGALWERHAASMGEYFLWVRVPESMRQTVATEDCAMVLQRVRIANDDIDGMLSVVSSVIND